MKKEQGKKVKSEQWGKIERSREQWGKLKKEQGDP